MPDSPTTPEDEEGDQVRYPRNFSGDITPNGDMLSSGMPLTPNRRPRNEITQIRYKQRRKLPLTNQERELLAEYFSQYGRLKKSVHLKPEREAEWTRLASEQGVALSQWIQMMVEKGVRGNDEALRDIRDELDRARNENTGLRGTCGELSIKNSKLEQRIITLEEELMGAVAEALRLAKAVEESA